MIKLLHSMILGVLFVLLSSCTVQTVAYDPGYSSDYVYTVGYYNNYPYWNNNYYYAGYGLGRYGYWGDYTYYSDY